MKDGRKKARYAMFEQLVCILKPRSDDNGGYMQNMSEDFQAPMGKGTSVYCVSHIINTAGDCSEDI